MAERRKPGTRTLALLTLGGVGVLLLVLFALLVGPWLFTKNLHELDDDQRLEAQNDVRTTLVQALAGLAVAGGLLVTYRTYRLAREDQERRHQREDRTYERDLYTQAVEQLGHEQAAVRIGALYSLESLAQDQSEWRQTVVDVLCAYLRMPYTPQSAPGPRAEPAAAQEMALPLPAHDPAQELQVRQTAQRILATHLRRPAETSGLDAQGRPPTPHETFWPGINLDLTGATLVELDLRDVSVVAARFRRATFTGAALFDDATFTSAALFHEATFTGAAFFGEATITGATFYEATFSDIAEFGMATFTEDAVFSGATFTGNAGFGGAYFTGVAEFERTTFTSVAYFRGATFTGNAGFGGADFTGAADFSTATFISTASFSEATFTGGVRFHEATFTSAAQFYVTTFGGAAEFDRVTFTRDPVLHGANVMYLNDPLFNPLRSWPPGWTVRPDPVDPSRGMLEPMEEDREQPMTPPV
jgi:uncharacterized protein YjbI with pentapeptide repeats